jgi:hypothetical protein
VVGYEQLQVELPGCAHTFTIGINNKTLKYWIGAGWMQGSLAFNFHQADPASAFRRQSGVITQNGNINSLIPGCLQDSLSRISLDLFTINGEVKSSHDLNFSFYLPCFYLDDFMFSFYENGATVAGIIASAALHAF